MIYRGGTVIAPCWGEMGRYLAYRNIFKIQRSAELSSHYRSNLLISLLDAGENGNIFPSSFAEPPFPRVSAIRRVASALSSLFPLCVINLRLGLLLRTWNAGVLRYCATRHAAMYDGCCVEWGGGGLNSWDSLSKARTNVITKRDEKSARISDLSSNFLENKIRHSITRIDRLISLRPVDCETMLVNCVARIKYISS